MDELAKALAEAIRAGSILAPSVVVGYYGVRVLEALSSAGMALGVVWLVCQTVRFGINRSCLVDELRIGARKDL